MWTQLHPSNNRQVIISLGVDSLPDSLSACSSHTKQKGYTTHPCSNNVLFQLLFSFTFLTEGLKKENRWFPLTKWTHPMHRIHFPLDIEECHRFCLLLLFVCCICGRTREKQIKPDLVRWILHGKSAELSYSWLASWIYIKLSFNESRVTCRCDSVYRMATFGLHGHNVMWKKAPISVKKTFSREIMSRPGL